MFVVGRRMNSAKKEAKSRILFNAIFPASGPSESCGMIAVLIPWKRNHVLPGRSGRFVLTLVTQRTHKEEMKKAQIVLHAIYSLSSSRSATIAPP
jgi:hypothetical protein